MVLTEQALAAAAALREAFEAINHGVDLMRAGEHISVLSVSATPAFATRWLVDRLPRFQRKYPRIRLRIASSPAPVDFEQDDIDVAIRLGRGGFEGVLATELFPERIVPVAAPSLLRKHPVRRAADILKAPLIHDDSMRKSGRAHGWQDWLKAAKVSHAAIPTGTHYDDGHLALQAAAAGTGIALGRLVYAADDLLSKRLRVAFAPIVKLDLGYQLLIPEAKASRPAVASFREWILEESEQFGIDIDRLVSGRAAARG